MEIVSAHHGAVIWIDNESVLVDIWQCREKWSRDSIDVTVEISVRNIVFGIDEFVEVFVEVDRHCNLCIVIQNILDPVNVCVSGVFPVFSLVVELSFENRSEQNGIGNDQRQDNAENIHKEEFLIKFQLAEKIPYPDEFEHVVPACCKNGP